VGGLRIDISKWVELEQKRADYTCLSLESPLGGSNITMLFDKRIMSLLISHIPCSNICQSLIGYSHLISSSRRPMQICYGLAYSFADNSLKWPPDRSGEDDDNQYERKCIILYSLFISIVICPCDWVYSDIDVRRRLRDPNIRILHPVIQPPENVFSWFVGLRKDF